MFAILFETLLKEIQEEIPHFAGWEGGGLRGTKIVNNPPQSLFRKKSLLEDMRNQMQYLVFLWTSIRASFCESGEGVRLPRERG